MLELMLNGKKISIKEGATILDAANAAGVNIPTMCHLKGHSSFTSCMVCVVKEHVSGRLIPSCTAPVANGMIIDTDSTEVHHARKSALDLLLSEHVGDCEAPCRLTCPAHMNIPLMIRQIASGKMTEAIETIKEHISIPAVLGRICPAPCEKGCRRSRFDSSVAICLLKRFVADIDLYSKSPHIPVCGISTGRNVAIVGAGPAGLSAAYYLARCGHQCTIFDDRQEPGGQLRYGVPENILPRQVLDKDVEVLKKLGILFEMKMKVGKDISICELREKFDALVLAPGKKDQYSLLSWLVKTTEKGIVIDAHTHMTSESGVFAGGAVVHEGRLAVRAVGHGRNMAVSIDHFLKKIPVTGVLRRFESRIGKIHEPEIIEFMKESDCSQSIEPSGGATAGFCVDEAVRESKRCMHCDCRKQDDCKLRDLAEKYSASPKHFNVEGRKPFTRVTTHTSVVFESGKCIKCGLCVRITEKAHETYGLTFVGRGFDTFVGIPFNESLGAGLQTTAEECVKQCPTGALAFKNC